MSLWHGAPGELVIISNQGRVERLTAGVVETRHYATDSRDDVEVGRLSLGELALVVGTHNVPHEIGFYFVLNSRGELGWIYGHRIVRAW